MGWAKGLFIKHTLFVLICHLLQTHLRWVWNAFKVLAEAPIWIFLLRSGEQRQQANLKIWKGKKCQWVWDKPCCKGAQVWWEAGHVFFWVCCDFCGGVNEPIPPSQAQSSPLEHCYTGLWGHSSLQRGNFSGSHGKCSPLRSSHLEERPWHRNTHGEPQQYSQLNVSGTWQFSVFNFPK